MTCEKFKESMSPYIDGILDGDDKIEFEKHLNSCLKCEEEFEQFNVIMDKIHSIPEKRLPDYYHKDLMLKLYRYKDEKKFMKKNNNANWKVFSTIAASFIVLFVIIGAISKMGMSNKANGILSKNSSDSGSAVAYDTVSQESAPADGQENSTTMSIKLDRATEPDQEMLINEEQTMSAEKTGINDRKIIYNSFMSLEVEVFDDTVESIRKMTDKSGGYVENSSSYIYDSEPERDIYLKEGTIVIRIPVESYGDIQEKISKLGHLMNQQETTENVTEEYIETESRIKMLEVEQDRLFEIMEKADKVEDLIKLEERLNQIRTDLEIYKSKINNWDRLVSFSTFTINLREVKELEPIKSADPNFKTRITSSFNKSINDLRQGFENFIVALIYRIIPIIITIVILGIAVIIFRPFFRKIKNKIQEWRS